MTGTLIARDIATESDVEQKIVMPLLTDEIPHGLGITPCAIKTKPNIRQFAIGKGTEQKLYFPDYLVVVAGLPMLLVEAKGPGEDLHQAYREARLYATELNAVFPSSLNPLSRIVCVNAEQIIAGPWDSASPLHALTIDQAVASDPQFAEFVGYAGARTLISDAEALRGKLTKRPFYLPTKFIGGQSVRNEEIGHNTFGATLSLDYRHLFNPTTLEERAYIVRNAYIPSRRRQRYVEPIDRVIRAAVPPSETHSTLIEDTGEPRELLNALRRGQSAANQTVLLVGGAGSGKSTFVDYLREVALPDELRRTTVRAHLNMNNAPVSPQFIYDWLVDQIADELRSLHGDVDFDALETVQRVYAIELCRLKKGPLRLLSPGTPEYNIRLADEIQRLQSDRRLTSKALHRYLCAERRKLLVVVFDNCDKRVRDEQLLMFQTAQWLQQEYRCLIILPLRDETYDVHRFEPPLDTALKDLVFRIEPPLFDRVLRRRIELALKEIDGKKELSYHLPNGMRVEYPASEQAYYLLTILKSVLRHDRLIRRLVVGLAGRDLRREMEVLLQFCRSGHIGENEILRIRHSKGMYDLPLHVVLRVILRGDRRFYDDGASYVKNLFACVPEDAFPCYFTRYAILRWLQRRLRTNGPARIEGYHRVQELVGDLLILGLSESEIRRELVFLLKSRRVIAEHLGTDSVCDDDLVCLGPAGSVHLDLAENCDYLAAVAEDTWYDREAIAREIAQRIRGSGHYRLAAVAENSQSLANHLSSRLERPFPAPDVFLSDPEWRFLVDIERTVHSVERITQKYMGTDPWVRVPDRYAVGQRVTGTACGLNEKGLFVRLEPRIEGLVQAKHLRDADPGVLRSVVGTDVAVTVRRIDSSQRMIELELAQDGLR